MQAWRDKNPGRSSEIARQCYARNKDRKAQEARERRANNPEHYRRLAREWRNRNKDRLNARARERRRIDPIRAGEAAKARSKKPENRIVNAIRDSVRRMANAGAIKSRASVKYLGCSIVAAKAHIEALWKPGMSWENYGAKGWHIDHVRPLDSFDLLQPGQMEIAASWRNLQPLWWHENLTKSNRFEMAS